MVLLINGLTNGLHLLYLLVEGSEHVLSQLC